MYDISMTNKDKKIIIYVSCVLYTTIIAFHFNSQR
jgi:hypothetical protein